MERTLTRRSLAGLMLGAAGLAAAGLRGISAQNATGSPVASPVPYPTGADDLVLRIHTGGGFVPVNFALTEMPSLSLYGDGQIITLGPQIMIFPPPALPNLQITRVSSEGIAAILGAATEAGLLDGDANYSVDIIADAPTTTFTTNANGRTTVVSAYALDIVESAQLPPEEAAVYTRLKTVRDRIIDFASWLPADAIVEPTGPYTIERLQAIAAPIDPSVATPPPDDPTNQPPMTWPLATPLADFPPYDLSWLGEGTRCTAIEGDDLATLVAALANANSLTPWESDGTLYEVYLRPLLPDDEVCSTGDGPGATPVA